MQKPHRFVLERVSGYADEAAAFRRRRRLTRQPFARVYAPDGHGRAISRDTEVGRRLFEQAAELIAGS